MRPRIHYAITAAAGAIALSATATPATAASFDASNPFYAPSTLPFQAPAFDKIKDSDYQPAIEAGMAQQLEEIRAIAHSPDTPTFENTIVAMEKSGRLLDRVMSVFDAVTGANTAAQSVFANSNGEAQFCYTGTHAGTDTITGSVGLVSGTAEKTWTEEAVTPQPTTLSTSLSGAGKTGANITVEEGASVHDTATLSGVNAATAGGTVTYDVYSDSACTDLVGSSSVAVSGPSARIRARTCLTTSGWL